MDADGATQEHRRAISGYVFMIDGGAVSWSSKKQELVTLLTTEAEYVATTHTAKEALWLRWLITELFGSIDTPTTLFSDSKSAIALTHDGHYHARTKHIDICYHLYATLSKPALSNSFTALPTKWQLTHLPKHYHQSKPSTLLTHLDCLWFEGKCWRDFKP